MITSETRLTDALQNVLSAGEVGVQVAAYLGDELIIDATAGSFGDAANTAVDSDTLFPVFSVTKAVVATAAHLQVQRGLLTYDEPIAHRWPEYGVNGKQDITLGHVLAHRSGAPQLPAGISRAQLLNWDWVVEELAALPAVAAPGTENAYSAFAFGHIVGELIRRCDPEGRSFHQYVRDEVLDPLGMDDFYLGLPTEKQCQVATLVGDGTPVPVPGSLHEMVAPPNIALSPELLNRPDVQAAGLPAAGAIANARSCARLFSLYAQLGVLDGRRILSTETISRCLTPRPSEVDKTFGNLMPVGLGGLWTSAPGVSAGGPLTDRVLSHTGAGGTIAWAELDSGLSVAICHNRMFFGPQPTAVFEPIGDAIRAIALGAARP